MNIVIEGAEELQTKLHSLMRLTDAIEMDAGPAICEIMRRTASAKLSASKAVDTGELRDSVESRSSEFVHRTGEHTVEMGIETSAPHAIFIEYGTGSAGDPAVPHTSKDSWVYFNDRKQDFRTAKPMEARPFMRPALYDNQEAFVAVIEGVIQEVFEQ